MYYHFQVQILLKIFPVFLCHSVKEHFHELADKFRTSCHLQTFLSCVTSNKHRFYFQIVSLTDIFYKSFVSICEIESYFFTARFCYASRRKNRKSFQQNISDASVFMHVILYTSNIQRFVLLPTSVKGFFNFLNIPF